MDNNKVINYDDIVVKYIEKLESKYLSLPEDDEKRKKFIEFKNSKKGISKEEKEELLKEYPDIPKSLIKLLEYSDGSPNDDLTFFETNVFSEYKDAPYSWSDGEYILNSCSVMKESKKHISWFENRINDKDDTVVDDRVKTDIENIKWVEIGQMQNTVPCYLFIDFTPSEKGKVGQVMLVEVFDENMGIFVIADSFDDFLIKIIENDFAPVYENKQATQVSTTETNVTNGKSNRFLNFYSKLFLACLAVQFISFYMIGNLNEESEIFALFGALFFLLVPINIVLLILAIYRAIKPKEKVQASSYFSNNLNTVVNDDNSPKPMETIELKKDTFFNWLNSVLEKEIPSTIKAVDFILYEGQNNEWSIELIGSNEFDRNNADWACMGAFDSRDIPFYIRKVAKWDEIQKEYEAMIKSYLKEGQYNNKLKQYLAVGIGFDDDPDITYLYLKEEDKQQVSEKKESTSIIYGDGPGIRKFIASSINEIIEKDVEAGIIKKEDLFNNAKIYYDNGRNGTYFDWTMNDHSPDFTVCYNGKDQLGYIKINLFKNGDLIGYKWLDNGHGEAERISIGKLSEKDTTYLINLLLQNEEEKNLFDKPIDELDWNIEVYKHDFDEE